MEASGEVHRATNIPKLEHLQPKYFSSFFFNSYKNSLEINVIKFSFFFNYRKHQLQQIQDIIDSSHNTVPKLEEFEIKLVTRLIPCVLFDYK